MYLNLQLCFIFIQLQNSVFLDEDTLPLYKNVMYEVEQLVSSNPDFDAECFAAAEQPSDCSANKPTRLDNDINSNDVDFHTSDTQRTHAVELPQVKLDIDPIIALDIGNDSEVSKSIKEEHLEELNGTPEQTNFIEQNATPLSSRKGKTIHSDGYFYDSLSIDADDMSDILLKNAFTAIEKQGAEEGRLSGKNSYH